MRNFYLLSILCVLFSSALPAHAQIQVLGLHFKKTTKKRVTLPFQQYNNLIIISLKINNLHDSLNFVVDTGVGYTLITDPAVKDRLKLNCTRTVKISGFGRNDALNGCVAQVQKITIGKHILAQKQTLIVLEKDVLELSAYAGIKIHGLIGYDLFSKFVVQVDYVLQKLTLFNPTYFDSKSLKKMRSLPILIDEMKPYIQSPVCLLNDTTQKLPLKLLLDTGAGHSLSLDVGTHPYLALPARTLPSQLGMALNGSIDGVIGRVKSLQLDDILIENIITTFPDSATVAHRLQLGVAFRQGNIGCGLLSRFKLVFDYLGGKVYFKPNKSFKEPFEFSTSGIELTATPPYYSEIKIGGVRDGSPAYKVGLRRGDKILAVDDQITKNKKLGEIYKLLNKEAGKRISILVELSEGEMQIVELLLENPL